MMEHKSISYLTNLATYKLRYLLIRILLVSLSAILLVYVAGKISGISIYPGINTSHIYLTVVLSFNSIAELNLFIIHRFFKSEKLRWNVYPQILSVLAVSSLLVVFWIFLAKYIFSVENILLQPIAQIVLTLGVSFLVIHLLIVILSDQTREWLNIRKEIEEHKRIKLLNDYNSLQDRLNPHFLFNNLSVLKSLIRYNPGDADVFIQNFTNVYRYVLKSHEQNTITLKEELTFLNSYIALHKERLGEGITVDLDIKEEVLLKEIPPMALQLLVENSIKHNIVKQSSPLNIHIFSDQDSIVVRNNIQKKETTYSTKTGLKTLSTQYQLIANKEINILADEKVFEVRIPLL